MYAPGVRVKSALPGNKNPALKRRRIGFDHFRRPQKLRLATEKNLCALLLHATKNPALKCRRIQGFEPSSRFVEGVQIEAVCRSHKGAYIKYVTAVTRLANEELRGLSISGGSGWI